MVTMMREHGERHEKGLPARRVCVAVQKSPNVQGPWKGQDTGALSRGISRNPGSHSARVNRIRREADVEASFYPISQ
jgi:hypothetical protein